MKLTIHRGTHEIGGNCVEIESAATRIVVDVGLPLKALEDRAAGRLASRKDERIAAVFRKSPPVAAVLLSHAHVDHTGLLNLVPRNVPVYCSEGTSMMMKAGSVYAGQIDVPKEQKRILFERKPERIGDMTVTPHPVDHSAFGSLAFEIEGDGQRIVYSGDLRLHGRKPGMAKRLIQALEGKLVDVLLMEGTHFSGNRKAGPTEEELEDLIRADIESAPGLVLASFSPMHVDRLVTFYKATIKAEPKRLFAVDHYAGFVLHLVSKIARIPGPRVSASIRVFRPKLQKSIAKVERCFGSNRIALDDILRQPNRYVMMFRPSMLGSDFPDRLPERVRCLYSYWTGYLAKDDWRKARTWLAAAAGKLVEHHTSGHIFREHMSRFALALNPGLVIPIHTSRPEAFASFLPRVLLPLDGGPVDFSRVADS